jgi:antitoxin ParD1/3/4
MNVSLTPELERRVEERLKSGLYTSASELVREALRLFFQYEAERSRQIGLLDQRISEGLAQLDRGEGISGPEARRRSRARLAARLSDPKATRGDAAG